MKALVQRVKSASVTIEDELFSKIDKGFLLLLGVEKKDTKEEAKYLANKVSKLRVFKDENDKMNLSIKDIGGEILVVSQFTLAGDCKKGNRPGFDNAAKPDLAIPLYEFFQEELKKEGIEIKTGQFGANMQVELINDGPVTFMIEK